MRRPARSVCGERVYFQFIFSAWLPMSPLRYKGFTITARTFQVRGSGRWTLDLLIGQRERLRAFSGASTYGTEAAAKAGCLTFAQHIIDGSRVGCQLAELSELSPPCTVRILKPHGTR
jgi:hypothetical protein